ncbi:MAG: ankyrin repeat domain-containing protein [Nitrososphaerales archaeon]
MPYTQLQQKYIDAVDCEMSTAVDNKDIEIARAIAPLFEKIISLSQSTEFITAKLNTVAAYVATPEQWTNDTLNKFYQEQLHMAFIRVMDICRDYVKERKYVLRDNQMVNIASEQQKETEVERFRVCLENGILIRFKLFRFDTIAKPQNLELRLVNETKNYQEAFEDLLTRYDYLLTKLLDEKEQLIQSLLVRGKSLKNQFVKLTNDYHPDDTELLCIDDNVSGLRPEQNLLRDYRNHVSANALAFACCFARTNVAEFLLLSNISIVQPDTIAPPGRTHYRPLHYVAMNADIEGQRSVAILNLLKHYHTANYQRALDLDVTDVTNNHKQPTYGRTPLHLAAQCGNFPVVQWLVEEANKDPKRYPLHTFINSQEKGRFQRETPLHNAAHAGHLEIISYLLSQGASTSLRNHSGNTALMELLCSDSVSPNKKQQGLRLFKTHSQRPSSLFFPLNRNTDWLTKNDFDLLTTRKDIFTEHVLPVLIAYRGDATLGEWIFQYENSQNAIMHPVP